MDFTPAWERLKDISQSLVAAIPSLIVGMLVFAIFIIAARTVRRGVQRAMRQRRSNLGMVLGRLAQGSMLMAGLLVAITVAIPSFTPTDLVGTLGIGSVAIGFAFRDILQNFLAGILLLMTEPFHIDDQIVFGSYEGTVADIQTRATIIETYDGRKVVIPNAELFMHAVTVNTAYVQRRMQLDLEIANNVPAEMVCQLLMQAMRDTEGVLATPAPDALLLQLTPGAMQIRIRWWVQPPRRADTLLVQHQVLQAVQRTLEQHQIAYPMETQQIFLTNSTPSPAPVPLVES